MNERAKEIVTRPLVEKTEPSSNVRWFRIRNQRDFYQRYRIPGYADCYLPPYGLSQERYPEDVIGLEEIRSAIRNADIDIEFEQI